MIFLGLSCRQVRARLPEYSDGVLTGRRRDKIVGHLAVCASCHVEAERLTNVATALRQSAPDVPPMSPDAASALLSRVLAESQRSSPLLPNFWRRRLVWLALSSSAAAGVAFFVFHRNAPPVSPGQEKVAAGFDIVKPLRPRRNDMRPKQPTSILPRKPQNSELALSGTDASLPNTTAMVGAHSFEGHQAHSYHHFSRRRLRHARTDLVRQQKMIVRQSAKSTPQAAQLLVLTFSNTSETTNSVSKPVFVPDTGEATMASRPTPHLLVTTRFLPPITATVTQASGDKPGYARVTAYETNNVNDAGISHTVTAEMQGGRMTLARRAIAASARSDGPTLIVTITEPNADKLTRSQGVSQ